MFSFFKYSKKVSFSWVKSKPIQDTIKDNENLLVGMFTVH